MKKRILITGTSCGLGSALLKIYASQGADIIAADICRNEKLQNDYPDLVFKLLNVSDAHSVRQLVDDLAAHDKLPDVVIFNAAIHTIDNDPFIDFEIFKNIVDINMMSVFYLLSCLMPVLPKPCTFVFISSGVIIFPNPSNMGYYVSKLAVTKTFDHFADRYVKCGFLFKFVVLGPLHSAMLDKSRLPRGAVKLLRDITTGTVEGAAVKIVRFIEGPKKRMYYLRLSAVVLWITRIIQGLLPKAMKFYQVPKRPKQMDGG